MAEHSTADREVTGSTPVVPLEVLTRMLQVYCLGGILLCGALKRQSRRTPHVLTQRNSVEWGILYMHIVGYIFAAHGNCIQDEE